MATAARRAARRSSAPPRAAGAGEGEGREPVALHGFQAAASPRRGATSRSRTREDARVPLFRDSLQYSLDDLGVKDFSRMKG
jgi:hypothetical protein